MSFKLPSEVFEFVRCAQALSCVQLYDPMDYSPPGSSVHGILQARILEWAAFPSSRGSSWPRDRTHVSSIGRQVLYHWAICKMWDVSSWGKLAPAQPWEMMGSHEFDFRFGNTFSKASLLSEEGHCVCVSTRSLCRVLPFATPWTVAPGSSVQGCICVYTYTYMFLSIFSSSCFSFKQISKFNTHLWTVYKGTAMLIGMYFSTYFTFTCNWLHAFWLSSVVTFHFYFPVSFLWLLHPGLNAPHKDFFLFMSFVQF